jgi:uncharacterized protein YsxB (DUF464 family)
LIQVFFSKDSKGSYNYLKITGHSPDTLGKTGFNLLCAGVSTLSQSLLLFLKAKDKVVEEVIQKGHLEFRILETDSLYDSGFEVVLYGLYDLQKQFKDVIIIQELGV